MTLKPVLPSVTQGVPTGNITKKFKTMRKQSKNSKSTERTLMAVLLIIVIFVSPMSNFWAALDAPWFSPYLAWAVAIFLSWLLQHHIKDSLDK